MAAAAAPLKNIAWMGGSYAPPTAAHVNVAIAMGIALLDRTPAPSRCAVCIVPTSNKYDKGSVSEECVPDAQRRALVQAFVAATNAEFLNLKLKTGDEKFGRCSFEYMDYELNKGRHVPTIESMEILKEKFGEGPTYYIAQGQDNIVDIMKRSWVRSPELLEYGMIMYPRGVGVDPTVELMDAMTKDHPGKTKPEFMGSSLSEDAAKKILEEKLIIVPVDFNDDRSSSAVRRILQVPGTKAEKEAQLGEIMHPVVLQLLMSFEPLPYTNHLCEIPPSKRMAGGRRRKSKGRRMQGRRRSRRSKR